MKKFGSATLFLPPALTVALSLALALPFSPVLPGVTWWGSDALASHGVSHDTLSSDAALPADRSSAAIDETENVGGMLDSTSEALELLRLSIEEMKRQDSRLAGYTYLKTVVVEHLNKDLTPKKSETRLFEVTSVPDGPDIEVLVAVDGDSVSEKEILKSRTEQEKGKKKADGQIELESEELITLFDWTTDGHESVNGRPATILRFQPKPGAIYEGDDPETEKFLKNVQGRAWVDDEEFVISRIEFESKRPIKSFGGLLWTLHSFRAAEERKKLPTGVWIDSTGEYFIDATALFFKRIRSHSAMHTHDHSPPSSVERPDSSSSVGSLD